MKKKSNIFNLSLLLVLLFFCCSSTHLNAESRMGSIQIIYMARTDSKDEVVLSDAEFSLYPIQYLKNDEFVWNDDFKKSDVSLEKSDAEDREKQAIQLFEYARKNNISATIQTTDESGKTKFNQLNAGIYLLVQNDIISNGMDQFTSAPFLVSIPSEIDGKMEYDVTVEPKVKWILPEEKPGNPDKPSNIPEQNAATGVQSNITVWIRMVLICIGVVVLLLRYRNHRFFDI